MKERSAGTRRSSEVWLRNTRRPGTAEAWQSRRRVGPSVLPWLRAASVPIPPLGADRWLGWRPDHGQPVGVPAAEPAHRGAAVHVEGASQRCVDWLTNAGWRDYAAGHAGVVDGSAGADRGRGRCGADPAAGGGAVRGLAAQRGAVSGPPAGGAAGAATSLTTTERDETARAT